MKPNKSVRIWRSRLFGAMDEASKFVRGDAIAGLLITFINIIGGIIIGVVQLDMEMAAAAKLHPIDYWRWVGKPNSSLGDFGSSWDVGNQGWGRRKAG